MLDQPLATLGAAKRTSKTDDASVEFLLRIWACHEEGFTFLGTRFANGRGWREHPISNDRESAIRKVLAAHPVDDFDIYFCPNAFDGKHRWKHQALPTPYAWNDIDDADPDAFNPQPNVLWQTSRGRFQGLWKWKRATDGIVAEQYSRNIICKDGGDDGGWSVTKMLRLPGTINHKPERRQSTVRLLRFDLTPQRLPLTLSAVSLGALASPASVDPNAHKWRDVLKKYRRAIGIEVAQLVLVKRMLSADRSKRIFQIGAAFIEAGATDDEVASILWANAYFLSKWGQDPHALEAEISRIRTKTEADR